MKVKKLYSTNILEFYFADYTSELELPFVDAGIKAGFPSPADDFIELSIDLNKEFVKHKDTTFYARVKGDSMKNAGIFDGDVLIGKGDVYLQTQFILQKIGKALEQAGSSLEHVVRTRMFITDISLWEDAGRAHGEVFGNIKPASTMVEVSALIDQRLLIEIEATAIIPTV